MGDPQPVSSAPLQGADDMQYMELVLNVYASKTAKSAVARYLGHIQVDKSSATSRLTEASRVPPLPASPFGLGKKA